MRCQLTNTNGRRVGGRPHAHCFAERKSGRGGKGEENLVIFLNAIQSQTYLESHVHEAKVGEGALGLLYSLFMKHAARSNKHRDVTRMPQN